MFDLSSPPEETPNVEYALTKRHAPIMYFDSLEPFLPVTVGYTVFTEDADSPS